MEQLVAAEMVTPRALDPAARQELGAELYDLYSCIFRGIDRASFFAQIVESKAEHVWIQLYRGADGALGGFMAIQIFERKVAGRPVAIVRCQSGTLRQHRGANIVSGFFADRVLRYRLAHPRCRLYFLGLMIHPSSYSQLLRYVGDVWPREGVEMPAEIRELVEHLADAFGLERVDPANPRANPMVRKIECRTRDSRGDRAYWERSERPGVQFFLRANPGYETEGHGLLTIAPLSLGTLTSGIARYAYAKGERRARTLAARARAGLAAGTRTVITALLPATTG